MNNAALTEQDFIKLLLLVPAAERATVLIELKAILQGWRNRLTD